MAPLLKEQFRPLETVRRWTRTEVEQMAPAMELVSSRVQPLLMRSFELNQTEKCNVM